MWASLAASAALASATLRISALFLSFCLTSCSKLGSSKACSLLAVFGGLKATAGNWIWLLRRSRPRYLHDEGSPAEQTNFFDKPALPRRSTLLCVLVLGKAMISEEPR